MLPSQYRLTRKEIHHLFQTNAFSYSTRYLRIRAIIVPNAVCFKCAVIVGTLVSKKAVVRNRIKRILRETIRAWVQEFPKNIYFVITAQKEGSILVNKKAAEAQLQQLINRFKSI